MHFNMIGAGRLGQTLALTLMAHGHQLQAVCNRSLPSALKVVETLGKGQAVARFSLLPEADVIFITTPDDAIAQVVDELLEHKNARASQIIVHCSGSLSSDVLHPLQKFGCFTASVHPLKAFRSHHLESNTLEGCPCVVEGDPQATQPLIKWLQHVGAKIITLQPNKKGIYHAAAVMASNYVVTLAYSALELLTEAGLTQDQAQFMIHNLMDSSMKNLRQTQHPQEALTGPLVRGDIATIRQHLQAINHPSVKALYRYAGLATLNLTAHPSGLQEALKTLLNQEEV